MSKYFFLVFPAQNSSIYGSINVIVHKQRDVGFAVRVANFQNRVWVMEVLEPYFCPIRIM